MPSLRVTLLSALCFLFSTGGVSLAQTPPPLERPTGPIILTITGEIAITNAQGAAEFDLEMLRDIGFEDLETETPWTEHKSRFSGLPLYRLLERIQANGTVIHAEALNGYRALIPVNDAVPGGAFIAAERDGVPMPVRDKGPLWIVYPFEDKMSARSSKTYARSVWQLNRFDIRHATPPL